MRTIEIVDHRDDWKDQFLLEKTVIQQTVGNVVLSIHHIGSTAIRGMGAKPIIDILIEVADLCYFDKLSRLLESIEYEAMGEHGISGRRFFIKGEIRRTHHIHAFESGHPDIQRHLLFRDYMNTFQEKARQYHDLKKSLAVKFKLSPDLYSEGKGTFIREVDDLASAWSRLQRSHPTANQMVEETLTSVPGCG